MTITSRARTTALAIKVFAAIAVFPFYFAAVMSVRMLRRMWKDMGGASHGRFGPGYVGPYA